jgi:mono/diheme cytochrome c family protein
MTEPDQQWSDQPRDHEPREHEPHEKRRAKDDWAKEEESERGVLSMHAPIMREQAEPSEGYEPIPVWLVFCFLALAGWGGWYIGQYNGGWRSDIYSEAPGEWAVITRGLEQRPEPEPVDFATLGQRLYVQCAACHQADGEGVPDQYPPLADSEWVLGPPETLVRLLLHGLTGPIEVRGEQYNDAMPGWEDRLDDREIAAVLSHIRSEWGNDAPEVAPELVGELRERHQGRTRAWTADELKALEAGDG